MGIEVDRGVLVELVAAWRNSTYVIPAAFQAKDMVTDDDISPIEVRG
jgi:hypothetical protein